MCLFPLSLTAVSRLCDNIFALLRIQVPRKRLYWSPCMKISSPCPFNIENAKIFRLPCLDREMGVEERNSARHNCIYALPHILSCKVYNLTWISRSTVARSFREILFLSIPQLCLYYYYRYYHMLT